jgi:hypothetical protein
MNTLTVGELNGAAGGCVLKSCGWKGSPCSFLPGRALDYLRHLQRAREWRRELGAEVEL